MFNTKKKCDSCKHKLDKNDMKEVTLIGSFYSSHISSIFFFLDDVKKMTEYYCEICKPKYDIRVKLHEGIEHYYKKVKGSVNVDYKFIEVDKDGNEIEYIHCDECNEYPNPKGLKQHKSKKH